MVDTFLPIQPTRSVDRKGRINARTMDERWIAIEIFRWNQAAGFGGLMFRQQTSFYTSLHRIGFADLD